MNITNVNADNFEAEVLNSDIPVLVDFWATWCGPCKMLSPIIDELAEEYDGKIKFVKIDIDDNGEIATKFGVMSIPTVIVFKDGEPVVRTVGLQPKPALAGKLDSVL